MQKNNVFLVGDAASQVKATTGGGIIQGLTAAKALADCITKNKNYEKQCKKFLAKDLWLHSLMRKTMNKFKCKDWNFLINLCNKKSNKQILEAFDRD